MTDLQKYQDETSTLINKLRDYLDKYHSLNEQAHTNAVEISAQLQFQIVQLKNRIEVLEKDK